MSVRLLKQRNGVLRDDWYGVYNEGTTKKTINLGIRWQGNPPSSGSMRDAGDEAFENSRKEAEKSLDDFVEESKRKGKADHLVERLIENKTGRAVEYASIEGLVDSWRNMGRETRVSERYLRVCDAHFRRFAEFMRSQNPKALFLYEVTDADVGAFVQFLQNQYARKTVQDGIKLLNKSFSSFLPVGVANPFASLLGRRRKTDGETIHRKPFTPDELRALLDAAISDDFMYPLISTAICTGMRRGDVCKLKWVDVDFKEGVLSVKTSKSGSQVEIPIFNSLRTVLQSRQGNDSEFVFPEAAEMLKNNPDGLTWRFKKIVARAFDNHSQHTIPGPIPAADIKAEGLSAIERHYTDQGRRDRVIDTFNRYCAGDSIRKIVTETGYCKATVSNDLHRVQELIGKPFLRVQHQNIRSMVRTHTQVTRNSGQRSASIRDWHALRATWVTLALTSGVPIELVKRVTGHATVDVVLRHYFRPDRQQFKKALAELLPDILIDGIHLPPTNTSISNPDNPITTEMDALLEKIRSGAANESDKARFRELAAQV